MSLSCCQRTKTKQEFICYFIQMQKQLNILTIFDLPILSAIALELTAEGSILLLDQQGEACYKASF